MVVNHEAIDPTTAERIIKKINWNISEVFNDCCPNLKGALCD